MNDELFKSTGYATTITGAAFTLEIRFDRLRIRLADRTKTMIVKTSSLESVNTLSNGQTKLALALRKDVIIPTSHHEAVQVAKALNLLIAERKTVEIRRILGARTRPPTIRRPRRR